MSINLLDYNTFSINTDLKEDNSYNKKSNPKSHKFEGKNKVYKIVDITDNKKKIKNLNKNISKLNSHKIKSKIDLQNFSTEQIHKIDKIKEKLDRLNITKKDDQFPFTSQFIIKNSENENLNSEEKNKPLSRIENLFFTNFKEEEILFDEKEEIKTQVRNEKEFDKNNYNCNTGNMNLNIIEIEEN